MDKAEIVRRHQSVENCRTDLTRSHKLGRGLILLSTKKPKDDETIEQALQERDAYNANLIAITNIRDEMGRSAVGGSHGTLDQLETIFVGQNNQIKKGIIDTSRDTRQKSIRISRPLIISKYQKRSNLCR